MTTNYKLDRVEDGFARVTTIDGTTIGYVSREKHGSTRTGTRWVATRTRTRTMTLGVGHTRRDAVEHVLTYARKTGRI